ncbi:TrmH family RNA methyltransferase [Lacunimicrobium album]
MPIVRIDDVTDERLAVYQEVRQTNLTRWSGRFIAEGWRVVERLIASGLEVESVLISERRGEEFGPFFDRLAPEVPVYLVEQKAAEGLVGYNFHAGVLACGKRPGNATLEELVEGRRALQGKPAVAHEDKNALVQPVAHGVGTEREKTGRLVWCPGLNSPENLGTIMRLAAAFGVSGVLVGPGAPDPFSRRVVRTSMGNLFSLQVREVANAVQEIEWLKREAGYQVYATVLSEKAVDLDQVVPAERSLLVFGNEAEGLSEQYRKLADVEIVIPMAEGVDSLNVSHAASICLYHFRGRKAGTHRSGS